MSCVHTTNYQLSLKNSQYTQSKYISNDPHQTYPYAHVVAELAWSRDPDSYAGGSVAIGTASHAREVKGDDSD